MLELWLPAFALTLAIELPLVALTSGHAWTDWRWRLRVVGVGVLANLLTHPLATLLWWSAPRDFEAPPWERLGLFLALEAGVMVAECLAYRFATPTSWRRALVIAVVANVISASASPELPAMLSWN